MILARVEGYVVATKKTAKMTGAKFLFVRPMLIDPANPKAFKPGANTSWTASVESGTPLYSTPGSATASALAVGVLEDSNVDLTGELVSLMSAQRNYQANTKVISAQSEMMQSLMQAI